MPRTRATLPPHVRALIPAAERREPKPSKRQLAQNRKLTESALMLERVAEADPRPHAERMALILPFPPSLNNLYPTVVTSEGKARRFKSSACKRFDAAVKQAVAIWMFRHQMQPPPPPWALTLRVYPPQDNHRHDLSNLFKAPEDAVMSAIGGDDNDVLVVAGQKMPKDPHPRIELTLESAQALEFERCSE